MDATRRSGRAGRQVGLLAAGILAVAGAVKPALADDAAKARYQYILNCAGCHQADGSGAQSGGVPTLRGQFGHFLKLPEGRAFLVQVPGTSNSPLSDADIARMLNWMATAFSAETLPADFTPYTAGEVTTLRNRKLTDVSAVRRGIVESLAAQGIAID